MASECKNTMVSARLPAALVARMDFAIQNTEGEPSNRSAVFREALDEWLAAREGGLERRLKQLGAPSKKAV